MDRRDSLRSTATTLWLISAILVLMLAIDLTLVFRLI
jgi:hypothetical protein